MGLFGYWWLVLKRAWVAAWRVVMPTGWKGIVRDGLFLVVAALLAIYLEHRFQVVERHLMSADNTQDTLVWAVLLVFAGMVLFGALFFFEALLIVPYKMWKEACEAPKPSAAPIDGVFPDWKIHAMLAYLRPDLPLKPERAWLPLLSDVEDRLSTGQLDIWGRKFFRSGGRTRASLEKIDVDYWKDADIIAWSADPEWAQGKHTERRSLRTEWEYRDLQVNKAQALRIWPEPLAEPVPVERDKKLEEAIGFLMFHEWGRDVFKDTGDQVPLLGAALKWFHQLAVDGTIKVWARRHLNHGVYESVPADFWKTNHVDMLDLLADDTPKTTPTGSDVSQYGAFYDPMVSAVEIEKALQSIQRRGGIYSIQGGAS